MHRLLAFLFTAFCHSLWAAVGDPLTCTVEANGRFVQVKFSTLSTGGTYAFGLGRSNTLSGTEKLILLVTSTNSWNDDGSASANLVRRFVGVKQVRLSYPNNATIDETVSGSDVICKFAVNSMDGQYIYTNDSVVAYFASGLYTQGGNPSTASNAMAVVNNSAVQPLRPSSMVWKEIPFMVASGSNITVRYAAVQADGQQGRPVKAVGLYGLDPNNNRTATNWVTRMSWNTTHSNAAYSASVNIGPLTQDTNFNFHALIVPWIGPKFCTEDGVNATGSSDYCPLPSWCDKSNRLSFSYAYLDQQNGNNATATAGTNSTEVLDGTRGYFATPAVAAAAARGTNSSLNGNDRYERCVVYIKDPSTNLWWGAGTMNNGSHNRGWLRLVGVGNRTNCELYVAAGTDGQKGPSNLKLWLQNLTINSTNNVGFSAQGYADTFYDNILVRSNFGSSANLNTFHTNLYFRNVDILGRRVGITKDSSRNKGFIYAENLNLGEFATNISARFDFNVAINVIFRPPVPRQYFLKNDQLAGTATADPFHWENVQCYNADQQSYTMSIGLNTAVTNSLLYGGTVVASMIETTASPGIGVGFDVAYSLRSNETFTNFVVDRGTLLTRTHPPYEGTNSTQLGHTMLNSIMGDLETNWDVGLVNPYGTNRWDTLFGVGFNGLLCYESNGSLGMGSGQGGFDGLNVAYFTATNSNAARFVNNQSYGSASTNGNGSYVLKVDSDAHKLGVKRVLWPYDHKGNPVGDMSPPGNDITVQLTSAMIGL